MSVKNGAASRAKYLTITDVAEQLQVSERTVRSWVADGSLRGFKLRRFWRFSQDDVNALLTPTDQWRGVK